MFDEETEVVEPESTEEVELEVIEDEPEEVEEEVDWKSEAQKAKELADNYKIRAEKAEKKAKETTTQPNSHSTADIIALSKVDVEDIERVEKFMKDEGLNAREALANDELKAILSIRAEKRNTAEATNVTNVRRGSAKVSDETILSNASKGKLPETDEDINKLIQAKTKQLKN